MDLILLIGWNYSIQLMRVIYNMTRGLQSGLLLNLTDERDHFYTKAKQREKKKKNSPGFKLWFNILLQKDEVSF